MKMPDECPVCLTANFDDFVYKSGFIHRVFDCGSNYEKDGFDNIKVFEPCTKAHEIAVELRRYKDVFDKVFEPIMEKVKESVKEEVEKI